MRLLLDSESPANLALNHGRDCIVELVANKCSPGTVVDLGAGPGTDLDNIRARLPAARCHAVEVHPVNVRTLEQKGFTVHPINIERDRLPFEDESVEIFVANQILEHVKEVFWIWHEVSRCLRVGGTFVIGVPNLAALHNRLLLMAGEQPSPLKSHSAHVRGYTRRDLQKFTQACFAGGYALTGFRGSNFYPFPPAAAKPLARLLPNLAWGIFLRFEKLEPYSRQFLDFPIAQRLETNFYLG